MPSHAVIDREELAAKPYRGMNPAFVRQVWAKRRQEHVAEPAQQRKGKQQILDDARVARLRAQIQAGGITAIIATVAEKHACTIEDILFGSRANWLVPIRHEAIVEVAKQRPAFSLGQLGQVFNRDHTTILWVLQKYDVRGRSALERGR